jgi:tetratricopeptide (TPR) repeat protein
MSKKSGLGALRIKLDDAITYGTKREAKKLARQGLKEAEGRGLAGEVEYFRAQKMILQNKFASAIEHLDRAIEYNPQDGAAYNDRALCMVEIGIIDQAFDYFDQGIRVEPDYATIYHNKGWLLNNIGRHTEAIKCFKKALKLEPQRAVTYDNLADALSNLSDHKGALKAYKKVIELLGPRRCAQIKKQIIKQIKLLEKKI